MINTYLLTDDEIKALSFAKMQLEHNERIIAMTEGRDDEFHATAWYFSMNVVSTAQAHIHCVEMDIEIRQERILTLCHTGK